MRSRLATTLILILVLVGLVGSVAVPQLPAAPAAPPVVVLQRPADRAPAPTTHPRATATPAPSAAPPVASTTPAPEPADAFQPTDVLDLPPEEQQILLDAASQVFEELHEACGPDAGPDGADVMAAVTLDDRGILEMQLAAYDPELGAMAVDDPLPEALVACLDDVLWDLDWPAYPDGVRFALTTPFDPAD